MSDSITYPRRDIGRDASQHLPADNINAIFKNISSGTGCQVFDNLTSFPQLRQE